jgi:hypothetical protein
MSQKRNWDLHGVGFVAALAVVAMACSNDGDSGGGGNVGARFEQPPAFNSTVLSIVPLGSGTGDLYVGGAFTNYNGAVANGLVRLHADGTVDRTFVTGTGFNNTVFSIALAGDGSGDLYVGGSFTSYNGTVANGLVRLHADGTVDRTFVTGTGFNNTVYSIAPAGDGTGKLYVGGAFTSYSQQMVANGLVRLHADGTVDLAFVTGTGFNNTVYSIAPAGDGTGKLYVGGAFTSYSQQTVANGLVRLHADGTVDLAFATGSGFNNSVRSIALAGDGTGKLYVGGAFTSYSQQTVANGLVRLHPNGMVDPTFATGTGFNNTVYSIALAGDGTGNLYVGGAFTSYSQQTVANDLVRLHPNGTVDPTFVTGAGFNGSVRTIAPAGDGTGNLYVGGEFTSYQSLTIGRIVRLNSQGVTD